MRAMIVALLAGLVAAGCERSRPTYQLIIGTTTIDLPVYDDPKLIQDDIFSRIRPLWDELRSGESPVFYFQRTFPWDLGEEFQKQAKAKSGDRGTLTATRSTRSARLRFFKNRKGMSGYEQCEDGKPSPACQTNVTDWRPIELVLRNVPTFSIKYIREHIQNDPTPKT